MGEKVGVYVCAGCGIGSSIDTQRLVDVAANEHKAAMIRTSPAFCLEDAALIRRDVEHEGVGSAVIAACSRRVNTDVFRFDGAFVERVNIREQVVWSHPPARPETQALAEDHLRMGIVRAQKASRPTPYTEANERTVLVVGGGTAGLAAATEAARAGFDVVLVEKEARLGGHAAALHRQFPKRPPYSDLEPVDIQARIGEVASLPNVKVLASAAVADVTGQPGRFTVTIKNGVAATQVVAGAIVLATGWQPLDPARSEHYGLGGLPNVVTSLALEEMVAKDALARPSDGRPARRVAMVICDGPQDGPQLAYGGHVSSLVALKQAIYIRQRHPDAVVYLLYGDMQTPGQYEYFYRHAQEDPGILFTQATVQGVTEDGEGNIVLDAANTVLGGGVRIAVDLLVLSTGMFPAVSGTLDLRYLQGKELPITEHGFADSHFICFPYETRRTGIYSAGSVRHAMDLGEAARDGAAAALKAIQCIEQSSAGAAVHPRVGDLSYPTFFMQRCTSCGRCTQECPFGALELDAAKHPQLNTNRCRRCGICMGACPVQIISFNDYSVDMLSGMIKAVEIPEGDEAEPRILALACENDAYPALDMAGIGRLEYPASVRVVPVRCLGSVNTILIADAMSRGFDGVALMGCRSGADYQCHYIRGSELLETRMGNVRETLDRLALEAARVKVIEVAISDSHRIPQMLGEFVESVRRIGPNPMKGF